MAQEDVYTADDVLNWLEEGESLEYADLKGVNLSKVILKDISLRYADLRGAELVGALLDNVNFRGANLTGVKFTGASLNRANLKNAKLDKTNLIKVKLAGACRGLH